MAEPESVLRAVRPLPDSVRIDPNTGMRFTPNELALLKAQTGRTMTDLLGTEGDDVDDGDRWRLLLWLRLRRTGYPDIGWQDLGDIEIELAVEPAPADPFTSASSMG